MKMKKVAREAPYLQEDLLSINDFVRFCKEQGTSTTQEELKLFEDKEFLKPCTKSNDGRTNYAKHQLYPLRYVQREQAFTVGRDSVEEDIESILKKEVRQRANYKGVTKEDVIKEVVGIWDATAAITNDIRILSKRKDEKLKEYFASEVGHGVSQSEAAQATREEGARLDIEYEKDAKAIAEKHGVKVGNLIYKQVHLMYEGTFGAADRAKMLRGYVNAISNETFINTEYTYMLSDQLSWLIHLLGGKQRTVKSIILSSIAATCKYCSKSFQPIRGNQTTCGADNCTRLRRNEYRREQRQMLK